MPLDEYLQKARGLNSIVPLSECCGADLQVVEVEPLDGRSLLAVYRTCIVQCPKCDSRYVSMYD